MYQFINEMASEKASNMYKAEDKKISGTIKDAQIETKKPKIIETAGVVKEYKETGASIVSNLKFKVGLKYGVGDYRIFVYVDTDHNGIFNRWENISGVYKLDNNYELSLNDVDITAGTTKEIYASIPEKAKLGVVSWKLEVVKLEDGKLTGIRTCITGNSKVDTYEEVKRADGSTDRQPRTVNVLQLSDLSNATTPNLSKDITEGEKNFSNLLKSSIVSDSFRVKVTSRDIYTTDFSELPLLDYDVVIVGFVDENKKLSDENGLLNKFKFASKNTRLLKKILKLMSPIPYPGELKNLLKTCIAFSNPNDEFDYLKRLYTMVDRELGGNLKALQYYGFTVREIEILTGVSKSQVSRELRE